MKNLPPRIVLLMVLCVCLLGVSTIQVVKRTSTDKTSIDACPNCMSKQEILTTKVNQNKKDAAQATSLKD